MNHHNKQQIRGDGAASARRGGGEGKATPPTTNPTIEQQPGAHSPWDRTIYSKSYPGHHAL